MEKHVVKMPKRHADKVKEIADKANRAIPEVMEEIFDHVVDEEDLTPKPVAKCPVCDKPIWGHRVTPIGGRIVLDCEEHGSVIEMSPEGRELTGEAKQSNGEEQ